MIIYQKTTRKISISDNLFARNVKSGSENLQRENDFEITVIPISIIRTQELQAVDFRKNGNRNRK